MSDPNVHDLAIKLALQFALLGCFAAFTIVVLLSLLGAIAVPPKGRAAFYGAYGLAAVALGASFALGAFRAPARAADEVSAAAETAQAYRQRTASVAPADAPGDVSGPAGTIYIQVPDMDARFAVEPVWKAFVDAGFKSPGIEVTNSWAPSKAEVRYFNDADRPLAEKVVEIAAAQGLKGGAVKAIANYKAPQGQIEFWYPR